MANRLAKVVMTLDGQRVEVGLDKIREKTKQLQREMRDLAMEGKQNTKEYKERQKAFEKLHKAEEGVVDVTKRINAYMKDLGKVATTDLRRAYREGIQLREGFKGTDKELQKLNADLAKIKNQIDLNTNSVKKNKDMWGSLGTTIKNLFAYAGIFAGFNMLKAKMTEAYEGNKRFSDSMANVRKVSGLAMDDIKKLADNLKGVDSRTGLGGLMELSYTGAKLGFGNYGIGGLESFAKSAVKVQNALAEDMGEDSMTALSKMVEVMGLIPKMGVERAMDATGSAIFKLASTSTAMGTNIIEFTKRLMGLANVSHITAPELLALGSASDSMGLMAEVSATAFNKMFTSIQSNYAGIESAVGLAKGSLKSLLSEGRTMEAILTVFDKMHGMTMDEMQNRGIFKALGSEGARMNNVMVTMSNRADMLQQHLATARVAFEEGTAVAQEYAIQMDTAAAYSERAANIWEKAFVNPEGVDNVKEFTKAWYQTSVAMTTNEKIMGQIKFTLAGILTLLKGIVYILPSLFLGGAMWGVTRMLIALGSALKIAAVAATGFATAWKGMSLVTKTNWIGLAATAVFVLIEALGEFNKEVQMSSSYMKGFKKDLSDVNAEHYKAVRQLDGYRKAIDEAKEGTKQRQAAITNFNSKFGPYLSKLLTEKATAYDVAQAYQEVVKQMKAKIALQAKEKDIEKYVNPRVGWEANKLQTYNDSVKGTPGEQYNSTWLKGVVDDAHAAGKSVRQVADSIAGQMGLSKGQVDKIWKLRGYGTDNVPSGGGMGDYIRKNPKSMQAQLLNAINYTLQSYATSNAQKAVDDKYKPFEKDWEKTVTEDTSVISDKDLPDKTTGGGGSGGPKVPPELAEAKKEAEKASKAVIGSIEEYYRLQEAAANELAANGQLKGEDFKMLVEHINNRKDKMLLEARRAIVGDPNEFEQIRQTLTDDLINRDDNVSLAAIKRIQEAEPAKQGEVLKKFDGSKAVYGLDSNAFLNNIRKNAAQNELNIQRRQEKVQEEIDKILTQYHFVEQAQRTFGDKLVRLGLASDGYAKVTQQLADGTKITANTKEVQALASKIVGMGGGLYNVNSNNATSLAELVKSVMTDKQGQREGFASIFPDLDRWLGDPERYKTEMQLFYQMMIDMDDEYYAAMKKNYDRDKKLQNERWERSGTGKYFDEMNTELSLRSRSRAMTGQNQGENFAQMGGFTTLAEDPDIALYGAKLAASKLWLQQLEQEHADEKLIREAQAAEAEANMAYQEQIMEKINERITRLQAWTEPIEQFGTDTGQAMADAVANSESMAEGMEAALKRMALSWGQNSLKIIEALLMEKLKQKMIHKAIQTEEVSHQAQLGAIEQSGATAREVISQVSGATKLAGTMAADRAIEGEAIAHDTTMIAQDQSTATAENAINTSRAAGKTLADLGWWGIPLIAVIMALLNGLLQMALGSSSKESASGASNTAKKAKLVSGMLTYDEGNVGSYVGTDGKIYRATATSAPGTGLVTQPIATTVQGNPALVAEKGPEIVIGRLATRRIMMDEPGLIRHLAQYDKNHAPMPYRTFDNGNVNDYENGNGNGNANGNGNDNARLTAALEQNTIMVQAMMQQLRKPVHINMYGSDGLHTQLKQADKVMSRYDK